MGQLIIALGLLAAMGVVGASIAVIGVGVVVWLRAGLRDDPDRLSAVESEIRAIHTAARDQMLRIALQHRMQPSGQDTSRRHRP